MARGFKRKSVLRMWIISYLTVLILPLVASLLVYSFSLTVIRRNTETINHFALAQTETSVSRIISDTRSIGMQIFSRQEITSLAYASTPLNVTKREKVGSLQRNLLERIVYSDYLSEIYVHFNHLGYTASTEGWMDDTSFRKALSANLYTDYDTFTQWAFEGGNYQVKMLGDPAQGPQAQKLAVIMTYSSYNRIPGATLIMVLKTDSLTALLGAEEQYLWIADPARGLLVCPGEIADLAGDITASGNFSGTVRTEAWGEELVFTAVPFEADGWVLVSATPISRYTAQIVQIQRVYLIFLGLCLVAGVLISVFLARRQYVPVKRLSNIIEQQTPTGEESAYQGEFAYLEESLSRLLEQERNYERELDRQKAAQRQASLLRMLHGALHTEQAFHAICADYGISFSTGDYLVAGVLVRDYSNLVKEEALEEAEEPSQMAYLVISSITEESVREHFDGYMCRDGDNCFCIISPRRPLSAPDTGAFVEEVCQICRRSEELIRQHFGVQTAFYVSELYPGSVHGVRGIHSAYDEVLWGLEQMEGFHLTHTVLNRRDLLRNIDSGAAAEPLSSAGQNRRQFSNAVFAGNFEAAGKLCADLLREGIVQVDQSFSNVRLHSVFLLDYLLCNMESAQIALCDKEIRQLIPQLRKAKNMEELQALMQSGFQLLHQSCRKEESGDCATAADDILRYINEHYASSDLSVSSIAEHFRLSQSYLLRIFKRGVGSGVLDYIHQRRVDEAKILLKNTGRTVNEIAETIGYSNSLALIRAFKRLEGITPSAYRNLSVEAGKA